MPPNSKKIVSLGRCIFFLFSNSLLQQILTCLEVKYNQYFYQYATINRLLFSLSLVFGSNLIVSHTFRYSFSTVQLVLCEKNACLLVMKNLAYYK